MSCFKCGSNYTSIRFYRIRELAKGSPSKGKNKKYVEIEVKEVLCKDCSSKEMSYRDAKRGKDET